MGVIKRIFYELLYPRRPYWTANVYGFGRWIRRYGYYPPFLPLCIYTDHAPGESVQPHFKHEIESSAPVQFYHSKDRVDSWRAKYSKPCYTLHSPFVFARKVLGIQRQEGAVGTIYFLAHTTPSLIDHKSPLDYSMEINAIPDQYKPITICLHYHDMNKGLGDVYESLGHRVICMGEPYDQKFTERFLRELSGYKYCISNLFGSYALYATEMGVPFGLHGTPPDIENVSDPNFEKGQLDSYLHTGYYQKAMALFGGLPSEEVSGDATRFALRYLGVEAGVSRQYMSLILYRSLLEWVFFGAFGFLWRFYIKARRKGGVV